MKLYTKKVKECLFCPNCERVSNKTGTYNPHICVGMKRLLPGKKMAKVSWGFEASIDIPEWCPLLDVEGK